MKLSTIFIPTIFLSLIITISLTPFLAHTNDKTNKTKIKYSLFIDIPIKKIDDISEMNPWDTDLREVTPAVRHMKAAIVGSFFPLISSLSGSFISKQANLNSILLHSINTIKKSLIETLQEVNLELSETPQNIFFAYLPWEYNEALYSAANNSISFTGFKPGTEFYGRPEAFNSKIMKNIRKIIQDSYNKTTSSYYLLGVTADIKLQKNNSQATIEIILGLTPQKYKLDNVGNNQVSFLNLVVPRVKNSTHAPIMIVKMKQKLEESSSPNAHIQFGPFGGWNRNAFGFVLLQDKRGSIFRCGHRHKSSIYLQGKLLRGAAKGFLGFFAKNRPLDLRIYDLTMDIEESHVNEMNLYASVGLKFGLTKKTFGCFNNEGVDNNFTSEVNSTLKTELNNLKNKFSSTKLLDLLLSGNQEK